MQRLSDWLTTLVAIVLSWYLVDRFGQLCDWVLDQTVGRPTTPSCTLGFDALWGLFVVIGLWMFFRSRWVKPKRDADETAKTNATESPQQGSEASATSNAGDRCPRCGFAYGWDGQSCRHC